MMLQKLLAALGAQNDVLVQAGVSVWRQLIAPIRRW